MTVFRASRLVFLGLILALGFACEKQASLSSEESSPPLGSERLPFDRESHSEGISPSQSLIPLVSKLPVGTPLTIRLAHPLSSGSAHAGDDFQALLDDRVVVDDQTIVPRGAAVTGHVLAARSSGRSQNPGYLRIALVSLTLDGKVLPIETSSIFAKAGLRENKNLANASGTAAGGAFIGGSSAGGKGALLVGAAAGTPVSADVPHASGKKEISFDVDRTLTFRLAQVVDLR